MTERIIFRPRTTRTVRCKCLFLPSSRTRPVFCSSASCLSLQLLFTHFLPHHQASSSPPTSSSLHLQYTPTHFLLLPPLFCHKSNFHPSSSLSSSWISVLQNSKEEALNQAFKGDQHVGENNIVQELTKSILGEVKRMTGNDVCCDCGAPSEWRRWKGKPP